MAREYTRRPIADRFWEKVAKTDDPGECWEWQGTRIPNGYGMFTVHKDLRVLAHRLAWALDRNAGIPLDGHILHVCDNRAC